MASPRKTTASAPPARRTSATPEPPTDAERIASLESRNATLRTEKRSAEAEVRHLRGEVQSLTKEVQRLTVELEKVKHPPLIVGTVLDVLVDGRVVIKSSTGPNFVVPVADFVTNKTLEPGTRVSLSQNTLTVVGLLPPSRDADVNAFEISKRPGASYDDVGGLEDVVQQVRETIEYPLTRPNLYKRLGVSPPKGVLMRGLPGTGKTLLAKAAANATNATFIRVVGSELVQKFIGEGARRVREVFELAREKAPSIIFIDEIDAIGARRTDDGTSSNREVERTLMQLLAELDGFEPRGDVRILAATNRADTLDPALTRPGRFDRVIDVPLPTPEATRAIFGIHTRDMQLADDINLDQITARLGTISGADIQAVCMEAGMLAIRHERDAITHEDFLAAVKRFEKGELPTHGLLSGPALYA